MASVPAETSPIDFSLVIPAYNEARRLGEPLVQAHAFLQRTGRTFEIVVVANGCRDNTAGVVRQAAASRPAIRLLEFPEALGKGGAIIAGCRAARGTFVAYMDADGSTDIASLWDMVQTIGDRAALIGSRWLPGSHVPVKQTWLRRLASRVFNRLVRLILQLPYTDTQCAAKVFRRESLVDALEQFDVTGFAFDACLLYELRRAGGQVDEVPISWSDRADSRVALHRDAPAMVWQIIRYRFRRRN